MESHTPPTLDQIKARIMSAEEFVRRKEAGEKLVRYYEIQEADKAIHYFGADHSNNPENPMFARIEEEMTAFKPDMVYVEGIQGLNHLTPEQVESAKKRPMEEFVMRGESMYTAKLAIDRDIPVESPEPDPAEELKYVLEQGCSEKDVFSYYIFRVVHQYQNHFKGDERFGPVHLSEYLAPHLRQLKEAASWNEERWRRLLYEFWNELRLDDTAFYAEQADPMPWSDREKTSVNSVAGKVNRYRDEYIVARIAEGLKKHSRLFVVYGSSHAEIQEPALREVIKM